MTTERKGKTMKTACGRRSIALLLRAAAAIYVGGVGNCAWAQSSDGAGGLPGATAPATSSESAGDIVVTGSRISASGFNSPTPLTVIGTAQLERAGVTNIGQLAQQVPSFQASFSPANSTLNSQSAGSAFLNLRNLGNNRTLVLINGHRFVPTTSSALIDTNVIPSSIVDRVEVVTGGASAAYGSDAVAGVVNLILKRDLVGFRGDAQTGISTYGDNATYRGSLAWGTSFADGRGHFTIAGEGEKNEGILSQADRPWADKAYGLISNPAAGNPRRLILPGYQFANATLGGLITSGPLRGTDFGPGGVPRPFVYGQYQGNFQIGGSGIEGSDLIPLTVPYSRYSVYSTGDYNLGGIKASFEASYAYSRGEGVLSPPFHLDNITIQPDNAYLRQVLSPAQLAQVTAPFSFGRFSPDLNDVLVSSTNKTYRFLAGLDGRLGGSWKWSVSGEYGHTDYISRLPDNIVTAKFAKAVDAVQSNDAIVCRVNANASVADDDPACVPLNLFGAGSPSQAAKDYVHGTTSYDVGIDERVVSGQVQGNLFSLGAKPVTIAVGGEYRQNTVAGVSDAVAQAGGYLIGNPKALGGTIDVKEAFAETLVPLLSDVRFARSLELNGAVRVTDYSTSGTVTTWKGGVTWQISDDIRLRATRSRDIRAPNFDELFTNALFRFVNISDPQNNGAIVSANIITQGNRSLKPEIANTLTGGVVVTPRLVPGLRASVDFFDIKIRGAVGQLGAQDIVTRCAAGNAALCGFITRNGANIITSVTSAQINLSQIATRGLDLELAYTRRLGPGSITLRALATYVDRFSTDDGVTKIDRIGNVGAGSTGLPHWKANASITYTNGPLSLFVQDRFVGGGKYDVTYVEGVDINDNHVSGRNYVDATVDYAVADTPRQRVQLFLTVKNLLNRAPPPSPSNFQTPTQTNAALYDTIGRMFLTGVRFRF